ncbi:hypothetical protein WR25_03795 isoform B [Diploscapter pachys]|uniref:RNA helicase n=1 Tax=Diploscapter pachys TaxID=2018661 RepID=A0A2A2LND5_9BILA|nr:hypothetical protein WR25_03795 isoform A [Diploscapter pachys]PAV87764.1 hypothetical protein WR25_03795 isoform B [Diploscapter pachys]
MFTKGFFGGGSKNKSEEAGPTSKGTSKPAPIVKPATYYNDSTDETLDESPEPPGNLEDLSKVIDVNSPEYYLQDDVPLRSNHDMPNPLNPPPINREHREQRPSTSGNKQKKIEPCSADDLRLKKHNFDIRIAFTCQKQGESSKSTRKHIDLNVGLRRHEAGEQYEQQREHEEATLQVDFPNYIPPEHRHSIKTWDDLRSQLAPEFVNIIKETYPSPNPLQCHAIPYMLSGQQIVVETPTGTGKTATYLIPAVQLTLKAKAKNYGPQVPYTLIIGNTNNLMHQVFDLARKLIKFDPNTKKSPLDLRLFACFAAATGHVTEQTGSSEICICTTGKLLDAVKAKTIRLDYIELLILDEADKMVNMTFGNEILQLHEEIVKQKRMRFAEDIDESEPDHPLLHYQVATFSATFDKQDDTLIFNDVQQTIYRRQIPTHIHMAPGSLIEQRVIQVRGVFFFIFLFSLNLKNFQLEPPKLRSPFEAPFWKRLHILLFLLDQDLKRQNKEKNSDHFANRTIVFVEKKSTCNFLTVYLTLKGYKFKMVNGDMSHRATQDVISELGDGHIQGVVATNKLARGADICGIEHIIILEMAADFNDYLHRIGRTGRIGHEGRSTLIFDRNTDYRHANPLYECLRARNQTIPRWLFDYLSPTQLINDDRRQVGEREEGGRESTADEESDRDAETVDDALERQQTTNFKAPFEVYSFNRESDEDDDLLEISSEEEDKLR